MKGVETSRLQLVLSLADVPYTTHLDLYFTGDTVHNEGRN